MHARYALGDPDDALDAVQDAMLNLTRRYGGRPPQEWPGLFYRIVENRIRDMQRHRSVRGRVLSWLPGFRHDGEPPPDPIALAPDTAALDPQREVVTRDAMSALHRALRTLPVRQREAFSLRALYELSVEETAGAMGVTTGSVKTHYSRALGKLRDQLGEHWL